MAAGRRVEIDRQLAGRTNQTGSMSFEARLQVPGPASSDARLLVAGDTHGNSWWLRCLAALAVELGCDGVVQLGDFGFWPDQRTIRACGWATIDNRWLDEIAEIYTSKGLWLRVIDGNHDAHPLVRESYPADTNGVRPLRDGVLDWADRGAVWEWHGVRLGALGGGVSIDRHMRIEGETWWPTETITDDDVDTLISRADGRLDVLFTHDAPMLPPGLRPLGDEILRADCAASTRQIARAVEGTEPTVLLHGHYHRRYTSHHRSTRVEGLASDLEAPRPGSWVVLNLADLSMTEPVVAGMSNGALWA